MPTQSEDFKWFVTNHDNIVSLYNGKYVVIKGKKVIASSDTLVQGVEKALKMGHKLGTFIVQLCTEGEDGYTVHVYSRNLYI